MRRGFYLEHGKVFRVGNYLKEATRETILIPVESTSETETQIIHAARMMEYVARKWKNPDAYGNREFYLLRKLKCTKGN